MGPAKAYEIVAQGRREVAHRAIGLDAERTVPFGQLRAIWPVNERNVRHGRRRPAHEIVDRELTRGVRQMVVAAQDLRDAHVVIVNDHGQHVGWRAVAAKKDEVVQLLVLYRHVALYAVPDDRRTVLRHA